MGAVLHVSATNFHFRVFTKLVSKAREFSVLRISFTHFYLFRPFKQGRLSFISSSLERGSVRSERYEFNRR